MPFPSINGVTSRAMTYMFETEEHAAIRATARRFAQSQIAPHGAQWEEDEEFPVELYKAAATAGIGQMREIFANASHCTGAEGLDPRRFEGIEDRPRVDIQRRIARMEQCVMVAKLERRRIGCPARFGDESRLQRGAG